MKKFNKKLTALGNRILSVVLAAIVMAGMIPASAVTASAAGRWPGSSSKPIKAYTISSGNNTTAYTTKELTAKRGTIYASDECYIKSVQQNSKGKWVVNLTYPTNSGRKDAWVALSVFTGATAPGTKGTATASFNTLRRPGGSKAGSVSKNDTVYYLAKSGNYTQILYNLGSVSNPTGWRIAWVSTSTYNSYVKNTSTTTSTTTTVTSNNPRGCIDLVKASDTPNSFYVELWATDFDSNKSIDVHVYVNGPAGSGAKGYAFTCNQSRPDVKNAFPGQCKTQYTGLKKTITIQGLEGNTTLYFYAINASGTGGQNVLLGQRTINIKGAAKPAANKNNTTTTQASGYAAYNGINYKNTLKNLYSKGTISNTEYQNRLSILEEAQRMVTVIWKAPVSFHTWKSTAGSYNSNKAMQYGTKSSTTSQFVKGYTYTGIPYRANAGYNNYNAQEWLSLINDKNITKSKLEGKVKYLGVTRTETTYRGTDCSGFVHSAYSTIKSYTYTDNNRLSCSGMLDSSDWKKINASDARPGDILLKSGHVMIYLGKTSSGKIAVFECVADGTNGASGCRYYEFNSVSGYNYYRFANIASNTSSNLLGAIMGSVISTKRLALLG